MGWLFEEHRKIRINHSNKYQIPIGGMKSVISYQNLDTYADRIWLEQGVLKNLRGFDTPLGAVYQHLRSRDIESLVENAIQSYRAKESQRTLLREAF